MSPLPRRGTPAGDAFLSIQRLARTTGADVQELLTLYALEGLLARLAASRHRDEFVLKGGVLLAVFGLRRPTKDIDLQATGLSNDVGEVLERIRAIAGLETDDGLVFDCDTISGQPIRDDDEYPGVRVRVAGRLGKPKLVVGVDVNFGDPVFPAPSEIRLPRLVDEDAEIRLLGYPLPMVVAEKVLTAIERGPANTRWRDFADVLGICRTHRFDAAELRGAFDVVAKHRGVEREPLLAALGELPTTGQAKWATWRRRQAHVASLPENLSQVVDALTRFVDPVLGGQVVEPAEWEPAASEWRAYG